MNKTLGSTLIVAGTTIGGGMLAMPLTSAGIGFGFTVALLLALWVLLSFSALLFVELYQNASPDAGIGSLAEQYYGRAGRIIATVVLLTFLYALVAAYIAGGGSLLAPLLPNLADEQSQKQLAVLIFTLFFGFFILRGTNSVDGINRIIFFAKIAFFLLVLVLMLPEISLANLMETPIDKALLISASPIFFTAFGFHGSIPSLNKYLGGNVKALRTAIIIGTLIPLIAYILWQLATHGVLKQTDFLQILQQDPSLNGLVNASEQITGSRIIGGAVRIFSAAALITSFLGVALGLFECLEDLLKRCNADKLAQNRPVLAVLTFLPPLAFALFYPQGFVAALGYAGQMFAFYAIVLPIAMVWKMRQLQPKQAYVVKGGKLALLLALLIGVFIVIVPFLIQAGYLPAVVG